MKDIAELITKYLSSVVEVLAAFVIGVALLKFYTAIQGIFLHPMMASPMKASASSLAARWRYH